MSLLTLPEIENEDMNLIRRLWIDLNPSITKIKSVNSKETIMAIEIPEDVAEIVPEAALPTQTGTFKPENKHKIHWRHLLFGAVTIIALKVIEKITGYDIIPIIMFIIQITIFLDMINL